MAAPYLKAREAIDELHRQDPAYKAKSGDESHATSSNDDQDDAQDELSYADAVEDFALQLLGLPLTHESPSDSSPTNLPPGVKLDTVRLAARSQHLGRFLTPRSSYPEGKAAYLKWRRDLYTIQADRAKQICLQAGLEEMQADLVRKWVSKTQLRPGKDDGDWGTQLLEDAAVLVFLRSHLLKFAQEHAEYPREKFVDIIRKTWRKLSSKGKEAALGLVGNMPEALRGIVVEATEAADKPKAGEEES